MNREESEIPDQGISKAHWTQDIISGFIVFLLALPLSVGIALASGFPAISGLLTAAIGGAFVGLFAGSPLSIKGPAAGMIVVILGAVEELGRGDSSLGVKATLAAIAVGGILQIVLGLLKMGKIGQVFPVSSVHGMLSAIGIIIISKQAHTLMGRVPQAKEPLHLLLEIPHSIKHLNPLIACVGLVSLGIMVAWPRLSPGKYTGFLKKIPSPLIVVAFAVMVSWILGFSYEHDYSVFGYKGTIGPQFLINIPTDLSAALIKPDFSQVTSLPWIKWLLIIVAVGSLESLLTVKAVDALAGNKRPANSNQDLMAVGLGNFLCGMIGGLPMIAEVVRSSANINAKAQSRWSNVFHGLFIAIFAAMFPNAIHMIPTAALSGLLIFTGYNLASPKHWKKAWQMGPEQCAIFAVTCVTTVATDLLIGIAVGLTCELIFNIGVSGSFKNFAKPRLHMDAPQGATRNQATIVFNSPLTFTSLMSTINTIRGVKAQEISVDFSNSPFIDCTSMTALSHLSQEFKEDDKILNFLGLDKMQALSSHPFAGRFTHKRTTIIRQFARSWTEQADSTKQPQKPYLRGEKHDGNQ